VGVVAEGVLQSRDIGPDVANADGEEHAARAHRLARAQLQREVVVIELERGDDDIVDQLDTVGAALVAAACTKLGRRDVRQAKKTVDAAGFPVPGIAAVDEHYGMKVSREPDGARESSGTAADHRYVE